jgi:HEAT repeats
VSTDMTITDGGGIVGKDAVIASNLGGFQILISRPGLDQSLTYAISVIPALLGFLVFCLFLGARKRAAGSDSGLAVIIGLLAAWLTILPLRTVLVPQELASAPQTRVDDVLIFDAAVVFLFITLAFTLIRRSPASDAVGTEADAQSTASVKIPLDAPPFISHAATSLDDTLPENRRSAIATLAAARTPDANAVLREALKHPIPDVRAAAAQAQQGIRDPDAVPALIEALDDKDGNVRSAAARALGAMKTLDAVPQLKKLRSDPDRKVHSAAARALRIIARNSPPTH